MKEVKPKRFAGPYKQIPFDNYIQSPVGLVPKDNGMDTRLIFHLSYPRTGLSVNSGTPKESTRVTYCDFSEAVRMCMEVGISCKMGKSDFKSAFRNLGIRPDQFFLLVLMARSPFDSQIYFFIDKHLPFGAAISCLHFQCFSDAVAHIVQWKTKGPLVNYLDDYFFAALTAIICNGHMQEFLNICELIGFLVSMEKMFWASSILVFLSFLIDAKRQMISVPVDKIRKALNLIQLVLSKKKTTVKIIQRLCGFLNFLCCCFVPGRAFTCRLYAHISPKMKSFHHVRVNNEMKQDLVMWTQFLNDPEVYCRPFLDFSQVITAETLDWFTDASGKISFGGIFEYRWFAGLWPESFLSEKEPSIEYLELYAVTLSILL